ncbi:MAG: TPM domain-containing protein [Deltaproteobacteria bacterium]|nr:TPM domain-containing protein [Deltaproteobacteria bacterium]
MPKFKITDKKKDIIKNAVTQAESKTSGEIAVAFIKESSNYALYELIFAVIAGFIYFVTITLFAHNIQSWLQSKFWDYNTAYLLSFYGFSTFLFISAVYFIANISYIDRLITPKKVMKKKVRQRALRYFIESGVCYTKKKTGILIFISILEHRVELIADKGISQKIEAAKWNRIVNHIIEGIKKDKIAQHLSNAVSECGDLLAKHFPIKKDDINELSDDIKVLEK